MNETLREIFASDFLLRNSLYLSLVVGLGCPLIGIFLVLRRLVFLGVALPQISATGVALALSVHVLAGHETGLHNVDPHNLAMAGSVGFALLAVIGWAAMDRRGGGIAEGRIGASYVIATAASILLLAKCPQAEQSWLSLFKGEIIALSSIDLVMTAVVITIALAALFIFRRDFLLVSADPEMALSLGKRVTLWNVALYLIIGATMGVVVLCAGPLIAFGFMLIPPLIAHRLSSNLRQLAVIASIVGVFAALTGFVIAYHWDLPVGPTDVALLGVLYLMSIGVKLLRRQG
ncbi:MAG TPA: metal ABC transporter permease [Methylomirabilota bacterium]|nr:metal ABC transporter permease [Methylomirabilota bacterium]